MAEEQPSRKKKSRRRGRRKTGKRPSGTSPPLDGKIAKAEKIFRLLESLYNDLGLGGKKPPPGAGTPQQSDEVASDVTIPLAFTPGGDAARFAGDLVEAFMSSHPLCEASSSFEAGRVYCHHCDSTRCGHAAPPGHLHVFAGYTPTGFPVWEEFFSVVLASRDPRIDDLLEETPDILALYQGRDTLNAEQLQIFGKESGFYDILGQVVTGYLPYPRGASDGKTAVTIQAVLCLFKSKPDLRLNLIGKLPKGPDLIDHLKTNPEPELEGLIAAAGKKLESLYRRWRSPSGRRDPDPPYGAVQPVLSRLARGIEGLFRRRRRRTRHARERRTERPAVGMALKDLVKAPAERLLFDELHRTYIVVGPKWRVHVLGKDGRHVTSMSLNRESVQKRIDLRRWRYTTPDEINRLRSR